MQGMVGKVRDGRGRGLRYPQTQWAIHPPVGIVPVCSGQPNFSGGKEVSCLATQEGQGRYPQVCNSLLIVTYRRRQI